VFAVTGEGAGVYVGNAPGTIKVSSGLAVCGEKTLQCPSGSEEVVLAVSLLCRTLSSVYYVSASSTVLIKCYWPPTIERRAIDAEHSNRSQCCLEHAHHLLVKAGQPPKAPSGFKSKPTNPPTGD
jgi:hypothetical protein